MDDKDERIRTLAAESMAQGFILELLLTRYLRSFPSDQWDDVGERIVSVASITEHYAGLAHSEQEAEWFADVVVRMQTATRVLVQRATLRAEAGLKASGEEVL